VVEQRRLLDAVRLAAALPVLAAAVGAGEPAHAYREVHAVDRLELLLCGPRSLPVY